MIHRPCEIMANESKRAEDGEEEREPVRMSGPRVVIPSSALVAKVQRILGVDPTGFLAQFRDANPLLPLVSPSTPPAINTEDWHLHIPRWAYVKESLKGGASYRGWLKSGSDLKPVQPFDLGSQAVVLQGPSLAGNVGTVVRIPQWMEACNMHGLGRMASQLPASTRITARQYHLARE